MTEIMKPLIIYGAGEFAELAWWYFTHDTDRKVAAFVVDQPYLKESKLLGKPVVGFDEGLSRFPPEKFDVFVAIGSQSVNQIRADKLSQLSLKGYVAASYISSKANVWPGFAPGENSFLAENTSIQPFVHVGVNVHIWGGQIAHHCWIGDHCYIVGASLAGGVKVGEYSTICLNASVRDHVTIGKRCLVGEGALILADTDDESVYMPEASKASRISSKWFSPGSPPTRGRV